MPTSSLESQITALGKSIFEDVQADKISPLSPAYYTDKLMEWAMADEDFRVSLFRFVDVLPSLRSANSVTQHVNEYFTPHKDKIPSIARWGVGLNASNPIAKMMAPAVRMQIRTMAARFILGETPQKALKNIRKIRKQGKAFSIDLLGEAALSEIESERYLERYIELIHSLKDAFVGTPEGKPIVPNHPLEATPLNVSVKLTALYSQTKAVSHEKSVRILSERLEKILHEAKQANCFVNVDMEDCQSKNIVLDVLKNVYTSSAFRDYEKLGMVFQAYLHDTESDIHSALSWIKTRSTPVTIRLVKGAYWDTETILAKLNNWPLPVWQIKENSDANYEKLSRVLLDNHQHVIPAFGSHNIRSLCHAISYAESLGLDKTAYELQALYGMADPIKKAFISRGFLLREYAPIGELIPGMGYLVRRLLENTSNKGFIRQGFHEHEDMTTLLAKPEFDTSDTGEQCLPQAIRTQFFNSPLRDFTLSEHREAFQNALNETEAALRKAPVQVYPIINGEELSSRQIHESNSPQETHWILAQLHMTSGEQAQRALESLNDYFPTWRDTKVEERAEVLFKTAEVLESKREHISAVIMLETGKPWAEADADVAEAIDFLTYYAHEAQKLFQKQEFCELDGEDDFLFYEPRGVCLTIGPWNFSLAIPCGMFSAALVTGNCVIMKPAEQSSLVAWELFKAFQEAGMPPEAAAFLPGYGEEIGAIMVDSPLVSTIAFTGSRAVGLEIINTASVVHPQQTHVKRVIAEMGGKNAVIIDNDADLDQAVKGIVYSAFGFAGQKCSACSRVIVLEEVYERFVKRLKQATESIVTGPANDSATFVCPVIDKESHTRLQEAIALGKKECTLLAQGPLPENADKGYYIPPTVFTDVPEGHALLTKEFFGPVLAVTKVSDFDSALNAAQDSEYALTGGLFSRSPQNLKRATREFRVGNLYLNRHCTGAMVNRQPFGGAHMSGVGSKAGGPDYLHQFVIPRAVSENTIRQGFAPMEDSI
tara:strand:+ start:58968 stop:61955 length:2988 start_codon:yes stop_codon:yes gene_type:complete